MSTMVEIPIEAAKNIADLYGYDQVVIIARRVDQGEHVTTYGRNEAHCDVAARIGNFIKHKIMQWPTRKFTIIELSNALDAVVEAQESGRPEAGMEEAFNYLFSRMKP